MLNFLLQYMIIKILMILSLENKNIYKYPYPLKY